ncbi:MAG: hypothetical protein AAGI38_23880, partial [Bacteroidota bacterium]
GPLPNNNTYLKNGGMGFFTFGGQNIFMTTLESNLNQYGLLTGEFSPAGYAIGGGGFSLVNGRYIFGGHGYGLGYPNLQASGPEIEVSSGGGAFLFGYVIFNQSRWLIFPTVGFGGMGMSMDIKNQGSQDLQFGDDAILAGTTREYTFGTPTLEGNLSIKRLISRANGIEEGGFALGVDVGYVLGLSRGNWEEDISEQRVGNLREGFLEGFYVRLSIGGGGFAR